MKCEGNRAESTVKRFEAETAASPLLGLQTNMEKDTSKVCRGVSNKLPAEDLKELLHCLFHWESLTPFTMRMPIPLNTIWAKCG